MEAWTVLNSYNSEAEARVIESKLNSEGIVTQLLGSQSRAAGLVPNMLQLQVRTEDLSKAKKILKIKD